MIYRDLIIDEVYCSEECAISHGNEAVDREQVTNLKDASIWISSTCLGCNSKITSEDLGDYR